MNNENLKKGKSTQFRAGEEQTEIARKGGIASGVVRGFKNAFNRYIKEHPEKRDNIIKSLIEEAENGNMKATEIIIDLMGDSVQREMLMLKKKELKMREKEMNGDDGILDKLDRVLAEIKGIE